MEQLKLPSLRSHWFIAPAERYLPNVVVMVIGDTESDPLDVMVKEWRSNWMDGLDLTSRSEEQKLDDMGQNGLALLFVILGNQDDRSISDAELLIAAADELKFQRTILSVWSETLAPKTADLADRCDIVLKSCRRADLLLPVRLLLDVDRLVGYDNADVFEMWSGRVGEVTYASTMNELVTSKLCAERLIAVVNAPSYAAAMNNCEQVSKWARINDLLVTANIDPAYEGPHFEIVSLNPCGTRSR